jgi:hypothetical protein
LYILLAIIRIIIITYTKRCLGDPVVRG